MAFVQYNSSLGYQLPHALAPTRGRVLDHDHGAFYSGSELSECVGYKSKTTVCGNVRKHTNPENYLRELINVAGLPLPHFHLMQWNCWLSAINHKVAEEFCVTSICDLLQAKRSKEATYDKSRVKKTDYEIGSCESEQDKCKALVWAIYQARWSDPAEIKKFIHDVSPCFERCGYVRQGWHLAALNIYIIINGLQDLSRDVPDTAPHSRDNSGLGAVYLSSSQGCTPIHPVTHGALAVTCANRTSRQHQILREVL